MSNWIMVLRFQGLATQLRVLQKNLLLMVACFTLILSGLAPANSQNQTETLALGYVQSLYNAHKSLRDAGLGGIWNNAELRETFFQPEIAETGTLVSGEFDLLTGTAPAKIDAFQTRVAGNQPRQGVAIEVAVRSGGPAKIVSLTVDFFDGDQQRISAISGLDWNLAEIAVRYGGNSDNSSGDDLFGEAAGSDAKTNTESSAVSDAVDAEMGEETQTGDTATNNGNESGSSQTQVPGIAAITEEFDGSKLEGGWQIVNEDLNSYLVENGSIFAIATGGKASFENPESANLFKYGEFAGAGDFTMRLKGKLEPKTGYETVWLGLHGNDNDYVALTLRVLTKGCGPALYLDLVNERMIASQEKPVQTSFTKSLFDKSIVSSVCSKGEMGRQLGDRILAQLADKGFELTLKRKGFRYSGSVTLNVPAAGDDPGGPVTVETDSVSRIEPFGAPAFQLGQLSRAKSGETVAYFDRFELIPDAQ
ncbi:hypothetical protein [Ahrensia marina]|nr:hypothetical protein [Ahrensia marina]